MPVKVIGKRGSLCEKVFKGGAFISVGAALSLIRGAEVVVLRVVVPVKFFDPFAFPFDLQGALDFGLRLRFSLLGLPLSDLGRLPFLFRLLEQRVLLHLLAEHIHQLQSGELKKFDRLLELGCDHQLLAQPGCLFDFYRHLTSAFPSGSRPPEPSSEFCRPLGGRCSTEILPRDRSALPRGSGRFSRGIPLPGSCLR